ncbi:hypothetical protein CRUP_033484 [Coryphaenoides rupestris]|nr:hypothetical protein CRUP_033484 [Coryphaenoides rupestris]
MLIQRTTGRLLDPLTGDLYHQAFVLAPDQEVARRLERDSEGSEEQSGGAPAADSLAPQTPRILLVGPPGSGKSVQAQRLADKYRLVDFPDSVVMQVLSQRLSALDCTTRGCVLHGFPRDPEQGQQLQASNYKPSIVFFLEMTEDVAIERLTLRTVDPVTGERHHGLERPAPNLQVQSRLRTHPEDTQARVKHKFREYGIHAAGLKALYPDGVLVNADQDPHNVFECVESKMFKRPDIRQNQ